MRIKGTLLFALLCLLGVPGAFAGSPYGNFLPPGKAFRFHALGRRHEVTLRWKIAQGYYLYRDRIHIKSANATLGKVRFPKGITISDPNFGREVIYRHRLELRVPVLRATHFDQPVRMTVTYQGCAQKGLCYPPITKHVALNLKPPQLAGTSGAKRKMNGPPVARSDALAHLTEKAPLAWVVLVFFGFGILLAFTPCVWPMFPILAGIVVGRGGRLGTLRGFALAGTYVLSMAVVYTAAGVVAAIAGANVQAALQLPWVIGLFAALFVMLALSMFGLYEIRLPRRMTERLTLLSGRQEGGRFLGAAFMGVLSALIVSPCVAAPLAGALLVIGRAGEPIRGGAALFALSLGMGVPLIAMGTAVGRWLPKAGSWMKVVQQWLGIVLLGLAIWLLSRVLPNEVEIALWAALALGVAVYLRAVDRLKADASIWPRVGKVIGLASLAYGVLLLVGLAIGGARVTRPLAGLHEISGSRSQNVTTQFRTVHSLAQLHTALADARKLGKPVMVDVWAKWCVSCREMENGTLKDRRVQVLLANFDLLRANVTANTRSERQLLQHFHVYGPPAFLFYSASGQRISRARVVGAMGPSSFLKRLSYVLDRGGQNRNIQAK